MPIIGPDPATHEMVEVPCEIELTDADGQRVATATVHWHVRLNQPAT